MPRGRKRKPSAQVAFLSPANAAPPSKKPRRMHSLTDSESSIKIEPEIIENSGMQMNKAQTKAIPLGTPSHSFDGNSRLNDPLPSSPYAQLLQSAGFSPSRRRSLKSQNIIDNDENVSPDPDSTLNGPSLNTGSDDDGDGNPGGDRYLWTGARRNGPAKSSVAHDNVLRATRRYMLALIYSGAAGTENTAWLQPKRVLVNDTMKRAWETMANLMGRTAGRRDEDVGAEPTPEEARKLYDTISDWRCQAVKGVRLVVSSSYPWRECRTTEEVKQLCMDLLKDDCFMCLERTAEPPRGRFCAHIISTALARTFWNPKNMGVAMTPEAKELFDPLPDAAMTFVCACIRHAIWEYHTGRFAQAKSGGRAANTVQMRIRNTFNNQSDARKNVQRQLIMKRVQKQIGKELFPEEYRNDPEDAVDDPYSRSIEDLPLHELEDGQHRGIRSNRRIDIDLRSLKSRDLNLNDGKSVESGDMGDDDEEGTVFLNNYENMDNVETDDRKASKTTNEWTWGDLWGFLEMPEVGRLLKTSSTNPHRPTTHELSSEEEFNTFLQWVKDGKGKHVLPPVHIE